MGRGLCTSANSFAGRWLAGLESRVGSFPPGFHSERVGVIGDGLTTKVPALQTGPASKMAMPLLPSLLGRASSKHGGS